MCFEDLGFRKSSIYIACFLLIGCTVAEEETQKNLAHTTWSSYLGDPGRSHYSTLSQITKDNVKNLKVAWSYSSPDFGQMQMNPIVVDTVLFGVTAALQAFAINAVTGEEIWRYGDTLKIWHSTSRGVSYWEKGNDKRIFFTKGPELFALNATTGQPIPTFGKGGKIDLHSGMSALTKDKFVISNTPGTIFENLIIMPIRVSEDVGAPPGDLMAFNVLSGAVEWVFRTIPNQGEPGSETWEFKDQEEREMVGGANNWAGMALDTETGILYAPIGSAAPDFYGGIRKGSNLYSNCLLALNARTGKRLWHFQFTHHDLWDRDPPAPPNLLLVERKGKKIPAVAQVTKQGYVYVFNRKTGQPLFDIEELPVPPSSLEGETSWPSQPFPVKPKPFARQSNELTEADISPFAENRDSLLDIFKNADKRIYAPPGLDPVFLFPGYDGAAEWGGTAADPDDGIIYVNSNEMAWILKMKKNDSIAPDRPFGERTYIKYCVSCHQEKREGLAESGFASLVGLKDRLKKGEVARIITQGKGMMTGFPQLSETEKEALVKFLYNEPDKQEVSSTYYPPTSHALPYQHGGYSKFLDANGLPAISPPWGTIHAIDLNTGEFIWSIPFGNTPELGEQGIGTGSENYGGAVVTENGLLFIAATRDGFFRVFDKHTGEILWEYKLPAAAFATPAMYEVNGKQYIAIVCGGEKLGTKKGNKIVAFALN